MSKRARMLLAIGSLAALSACATDVRRMTRTLDQHESTIELASVPFYAQTTDQCGPSALATILNVSGVDTDADELRSLTYIPARHGSLQAELLSATRRFHRIPYQVEPGSEALIAELDAGRPILVLQNLGTGITPIWHYAVVVGYLPEERALVLRSGDRKRHLVRSRSFLKSWKRADYWGFVALPAGEIPANADPGRYLRAVAALESVGDITTARQAYRAATETWPEYSMAWLALGNVSYATGELGAARDAYETSVRIDGENVVAMNNLSQVYFELGCLANASSTIRKALTMVDPNDPFYSNMQDTSSAISARRGVDLCTE